MHMVKVESLETRTESDDIESNGEDYQGESTYNDDWACYEDWLITLEKKNDGHNDVLSHCKIRTQLGIRPRTF